MFMGTFTKKIDAKGRVIVPSDFRAVLAAESFEGIKCFCSFASPCLEAAGPAYFENMARMIDDLDPYDEMREYFELAIFGSSRRFFFDRDGRITLDADFKKFADIGDDLTFVGRGNKFEIWSPERFEEKAQIARRMAFENRGKLTKHGAQDSGGVRD